MNVFLSEEWHSFIAVRFADAKEAMDAMADPEFVAWAMYEIASEILEEDDDERDAFRAAFLNFPNADNDNSDALSQASDEAAKKWRVADRSPFYHTDQY